MKVLWSLGDWGRLIGLIPIKLYGGGGGTSQDFTGANLLAAVARRVWNDTKSDVFPMEDRLIASTGGATLPQALRQADANVGRSFDVQRQGLGLDMGRRGIQPDQAVKGAMNRGLGLAQASARVNAENTARRLVRDRDLGVMGAGVAGNLAMPTAGK